MKEKNIMKSVAEIGKQVVAGGYYTFPCRSFFHQPKVPAKLLEMKK